MAEEAIGVSGLAGRYATALFDLAKEKGEIDGTEDDLICGMHLKKTRREGYCGKHNFQLSLDGRPTTGPLPFSEDELEKIRPRLIRVSMQ